MHLQEPLKNSKSTVLGYRDAIGLSQHKQPVLVRMDVNEQWPKTEPYKSMLCRPQMVTNSCSEVKLGPIGADMVLSKPVRL